MQLGRDFYTQEENWRRCFAGDGYLNALFWNGCATGKMEAAFVEGESRIEIAKLDAKEFDALINWLPKPQWSVYIADTLSKVVKGGRLLYARAGDGSHRQDLLGLSKYRYEALLDSAITNMKRHGGLV